MLVDDNFVFRSITVIIRPYFINKLGTFSLLRDIDWLNGMWFFFPCNPHVYEDIFRCVFFLYRQLQEDLTDEMVGLARQLKESSLMMSQSIKNTEKVSEFLLSFNKKTVWNWLTGQSISCTFFTYLWVYTKLHHCYFRTKLLSFLPIWSIIDHGISL